MIRKRRTRAWRVYLLSFLIPAFVMTLVCAILKIVPFGGKTLLISDMSNQYVSFLSYFRTLFFGSNDMFYTFSKSLGGDMAGLLSYYLFSPFNLITLPFGVSALPLAVNVIIITKLAACGLTFCIYLSKSCGFRRSLPLFSTAYALMAYNIAYCFNIMWLDGVIMLPLIILGINRIFERKSALLYLLSLFAALVTNWYIGFMLCIFSVLYFLYQAAVSLSRKAPGQTLKKIIPYALSSVVAAGLAAAVLIPAFLSLQGGKASFSFETLTFTPNFAFPDMFSKLFTNAFSWDQEAAGLPNIFCGIPALALALQYFMNGGIRLRERICSACLAAVLLISFYIRMFDLVWHGFTPPSWFPYRYSFILSFLLITFAYKNFLKLSAVKPLHILVSVLVILGLAVFVAGGNLGFLPPGSVYLDALLAAISGALIYAYNRALRHGAPGPAPYIDPAFSPVPVVKTKAAGKALAVIAALLALLQFGGLGLNACYTIGKLNEVFFEDVSYYEGYSQNTGRVIDGVKSADAGLYRMEKTFSYNMNDPMLFDYAGLTHFSSSQKNSVKAFLEKLGFRKYYDYWVFYNSGSTTTADSLLGVKYLLTDSGIYRPYGEVSSEGGVTVFRNPYALPLGFAASSDIDSADLSSVSGVFEAQNAIFRSLAPQAAGDIFTRAEAACVSLTNLSEQDAEGLRVYTKQDASQDAFVDYEISVTSTGMLYGYLYAPDMQDAELFVNGESIGNYFGIYRWDVFPLGQFQAGDIVTLRVKLLGDTLSLRGEDFYYENIEALKRYYDALSGGFCDLSKISSSRLSGSVNVAGGQERLIFSIPYERAWSVYIDGSPAETRQAFGALLVAPVSPGNHTLELRYTPDGLYLGLSVSGASLLAVLIYAAWLIRSQRRENKKGIRIRF